MKNSEKPAFAEIKTNKIYHAENGIKAIYGNTYSFGGLTKREYFAGLAMQGLLSGRVNVRPDIKPEAYAQTAILYADELLKQLDNES